MGHCQPGSKYELKNDEAEAERLNTQHYVMQETLGFLLHPSMEIPDFNLRIADVACGTGSWLLELARSSDDTCMFDGFDICSVKFPDPSFLPDNVRLFEHNALRPFPKQFQGQYDVVNLRLLVLALEEKDWYILTKNVKALLKPGGYIQWAEANTIKGHMRVFQTEPAVSTRALEELVDAYQTFLYALGKDISGVTRLPHIFKKLKMDLICLEHYCSNTTEKRFRDSFTRTTSWLCLQLVRNKFTKIKGSGWDEERVDRAEREVAENTKDGKVFLTVDMEVFIARKSNTCGCFGGNVNSLLPRYVTRPYDVGQSFPRRLLGLVHGGFLLL